MDALNYLRDGVVSNMPSGTAIMGSIGTIGTTMTNSTNIMGGDAHYFDDTVTNQEIRENLDSNKEPDNVKGLKWLLAMISKGQDVAEYFPDVVKNILSKSVEIKKMVYIYLVHYADYNATCREIALLSINSFQKDLSGNNQLIRGLALRVMTSIRVPDIIQIQLLAVRNCASDMSPYVRKCAATALTKLFYLDPEQISHIKSILEKLLADTSTMVLGSAVVAFNEVCPHNYELLHTSYRKLCHLLADIDEWSQVVVLDVLLRYIRTQFKNPIQPSRRVGKVIGSKGKLGGTKVRIHHRRTTRQEAFYSDEDEENESGEDEEGEGVTVDESYSGGAEDIDRRGTFTSIDFATDSRFQNDHKIALRASLPLLKSRNAGVVLAVCCLHFHCGSDDIDIAKQLAKALVRILRNRREIQVVILNSIKSMVMQRPLMFANYLQDFLIKGSDPLYNRLLKLDIMTYLLTKENCRMVLCELESYAKQSNKQFVGAVVDCIYHAAYISRDHDIISDCSQGFVHLFICYKGDALAGIICNNIRKLAMIAKKEVTFKITKTLVKIMLQSMDNKDKMKESTNLSLLHDSALSSIAWLTGEYFEAITSVAADLVRLYASLFPDQSPTNKLQLLNASIKISLCVPDDEQIQTLMMYILEMSRYDVDTDIRDRSRYVTAMMGMIPSTENNTATNELYVASKESEVNEDALEELTAYAKSILLAPKLEPLPYNKCVDYDSIPHANISSLSGLIGHKAQGYNQIPAWATVGSDSSVRTPRDTPPGGAGTGQSTSDYEEYSARAQEFRSRDPRETETNLRQFYEDKDSDDGQSSEAASASGSEDSASASDASSEASSSPESESESESGEESEVSDSEASSASSERVTSQSRYTKTATNNFSNGRPSTTATTASSSAAAAVTLRKKSPRGAPTPSSSGPGWQREANLLDVDIFQTGANQQQRQQPQYLAVQTKFSHPQQSMQQALSPTLSSPSSKFASDDQILSQFMESFPRIPAQQAPTSTAYTNNNVVYSNASASSVPQQQQAQQHSLEILSFPPKILVRAELAGGLQVTLQFRHGFLCHQIAGGSSMLLVIENKKTQPIRRLRVNIPAEVHSTYLDDIAVLEGHAIVARAVEMNVSLFAGKSVRIDVQSDVGFQSGNLQVEAYELLTPVTMSEDSFDALKRRLGGGFTESVREIAIPNNTASTMSNVVRSVRSILNILEVNNSSMGADRGSIAKLSGCYRKGMSEENVLVTLTWKGSSTAKENADRVLLLTVNCTDAVMCATISDFSKKHLLHAIAALG